MVMSILSVVGKSGKTILNFFPAGVLFVIESTPNVAASYNEVQIDSINSVFVANALIPIFVAVDCVFVFDASVVAKYVVPAASTNVSVRPAVAGNAETDPVNEPNAAMLDDTLPVAASHVAFLKSSSDDASTGLSTNGLVFVTSLNDGEDWAITLTEPVTPDDEDEKLLLG